MIIYVALAVHVVAVLVVLAAFFIQRSWLRSVSVVLAAVAICMPYLLLRAALGRPNPDVPAGRYEMYSRKQDAKNNVIYIMLGERGSEWPPRLFSMPFQTRKQMAADRDMGGRSYDVLDITITDDSALSETENEEEYNLLDPDKEEYYRRLKEKGAQRN